MYVTYDLRQKPKADSSAVSPQAKRVSIAGDVIDWKVGHFRKRGGKEVFGIKVDYEQRREDDHREGDTAQRTDTGAEDEVEPPVWEPSVSTFTEIVELPEEAQNIQFHTKSLPSEYQDALR